VAQGENQEDQHSYYDSSSGGYKSLLNPPISLKLFVIINLQHVPQITTPFHFALTTAGQQQKILKMT